MTQYFKSIAIDWILLNKHQNILSEHFLIKSINPMQLDKYMNSTRFARPDAKGFYIVFLGGKAHRWREWGHYSSN